MSDRKTPPAGDRPRSSREYWHLGKDNAVLSRQVSLSTQSPEDGAQLLRKAIYQLMLAVLPPNDRQEVTGFADCRERIEAQDELKTLFADLLDDLSFLDELVESFDLVCNDRSAWGDRFDTLQNKMRGLLKRTRRHVATQPGQADTGMTPRKIAFGGAILGAIVIVVLLVTCPSPSTPPEGEVEAQPAEVAEDSPEGEADTWGRPKIFLTEWKPEPEGILEDESRCFAGYYYYGLNFETLAGERRDCRIFFDWGDGAPFDSLPPDNFSIRWMGNLTVPKTGEYTLTLGSDDGSRLYIDGKKIGENWEAHAFVDTANTTLTLEEGQTYEVVVEFFESGGWAQVALLWKSADFELQPVSGQYVRPIEAPRSP